MTNFEYYKDIMDSWSSNGKFCSQFVEPVFLNGIHNRSCSTTHCPWCHAVFGQWLQKPFDNSTLWNEVDVDTKVLVRNSNNEEWTPRHFAKYDENTNTIYVWPLGTTSFTYFPGEEPVAFSCVKLYKPEEND